MNKTIIFISIFLFLILCILLISMPNPISQDVIIDLFTLLLSGIALGIAYCQLEALRKQVTSIADSQKKENERYLSISLTIKKVKELFVLRTQTDNHSDNKNKIKFACILIAQQNIREKDAVSKLAAIIRREKTKGSYLNIEEYKIEDSDHLHYLNNLEDLIFDDKDKDTCLIPLRFYYSDNIRIGNESPSFSYSLDPKDIQDLDNSSKPNKREFKNGIYTVRFYIFPENNKLHRVTCDSLIIK